MTEEFYLGEHYCPILKMISVKVEQKANSLLKEYDITHRQFRVIVLLAGEQENTMTMKKLESCLNVSQPTVVGFVNRLESKGFVESFYLNDDKRVKHVRLTDTGKQVADKSYQQISNLEKMMLDGLTDEEKNELMILLGKIAKNLI